MLLYVPVLGVGICIPLGYLRLLISCLKSAIELAWLIVFGGLEALVQGDQEYKNQSF